MNEKKIINRLFVMIILIVSIIQMVVVANTDDTYPTVVITKDGYRSSGSVFKGSSPLYPGCPPMSNVLQIDNKYGSRIKVNKIGLSISLSRNNNYISNEYVDAKDFLRYVKIKVEYKSFLTRVIKGTVYDGDLAGLMAGKDCSIKIGKDKSMNLKYSFTMDEQASDNIESISSNIDFTINISEAELEEISYGNNSSPSIDPGGII